MGLAAKLPGAKAVPERETTAGELLALLTMLMLPVTKPSTAGAKLTFTVMFWPLANVAGTDNPLMLNPAPVTVT